MKILRTASLASRAWKGFLVYVHGTAAPSDEEWTRVLDLYREVAPRKPRLLIVTHGAAPNAGQRSRLRETFGDTRPLMAIITPSAIARAAGLAMSWFNPSLRLFSPNEVDAALRHLEATDEEAVELRALMRELEGEIGKA